MRGFLELPNGIPSHDTSSDVPGRIDPVAFRAAFAAWAAALTLHSNSPSTAHATWPPSLTASIGDFISTRFPTVCSSPLPPGHVLPLGFVGSKNLANSDKLKLRPRRGILYRFWIGLIGTCRLDWSEAKTQHSADAGICFASSQPTG